PRTKSASILRFFSHDAQTPGIYTLSLHDALPISRSWRRTSAQKMTRSRATRAATTHEDRRRASTASSAPWGLRTAKTHTPRLTKDRKSTRLNSSHSQISYAVFCLKKKKTKVKNIQ